MNLKNARFGAFRAEDVGTVGDEAFTNQTDVASGALEAVVVPVTILERDEPSASDSCNIWLQLYSFQSIIRGESTKLLGRKLSHVVFCSVG